MTLIVEDGTGLSNANSYTSRSYANSYLALNKYYADTWDATDDDVKDNALIMATQFLDTYVQWYGTKVYASASLRWPRSGVTDADGNPVDDASVPLNVQKATAEMAYFFSNEDRIAIAEPDTTGITELTVDVITLKFDKSDRKNVFPPNIYALLAPYGFITTGQRTIKVGRT